MKTNILLIYDESKTLDSLKIETHEFNFFIDSTTTYEDARRKINNRNYDIVIISMDINIEQSLDIIAEVRKKSVFIEIIAYAHFDSLENILRAYKNGANDFIKAPIEHKILKAKIISIAKKYDLLSAKYFNNFLKYGDFVVDRDSNIVYLKTVPLDLSVKEYRLLRHLMKAEEKWVSKKELQMAVWGFVSEDSKSVEVTISKLKRKLDGDYIKTIFGKGYILNYQV